jgi:phenylacetate-CoA ligase
MSEFFDALETRDPAAREAQLLQALPGIVSNAQNNAPGWARLLAGVDASSVTSRAALAKLPVLRKGELKALQEAHPPYGQLTNVHSRMGHQFMSPGPIFDPEGTSDDWWRAARAMWAAGLRPGHVLQNCFGYHLTPGAWMIESGARTIGCSVIPAGIGQTEQQIEVIRALKPHAYVGTPSFLRIIIEKARELNIDISNLKNALVAAEALPPSLREWFKSQGLERVLQWYGTADLGLIAYETPALQGMTLDEQLILEIVRPGTGDVLPDGEVGEVVVTSMNPDYPMIRFGTGDLSAVLAGVSPCGRTNTRIKGWLGRADQTTKIRGMFVHPAQVDQIAKRFPEVLKARLVVTGEMANDQMALHCETAAGLAPEGLAARIAEAIRDVTKLRGDVKFVLPASLANDGKVIEDARKYD